MENKIIQLRFREIDRDIFEAIRDGSKKVETRAASPKFSKLKKGETVKLACGKDIFEKRIKNAKIFKTILAVVKEYKIKEINPSLSTLDELENMYYSFPNYREKIRKYGLIALELE